MLDGRTLDLVVLLKVSCGQSRKTRVCCCASAIYGSALLTISPLLSVSRRLLPQALMRHAANPHPALRAHALLLIGKLRLRRLQSIRKSNDGSRPIEFMARLAQGTEMALSAALRVSFSRGGHDWSLMGEACMALVLLYVGVGDDGREVTRGDQISGEGDTNGDRGEATPNSSKVQRCPPVNGNLWSFSARATCDTDML